MARITESELKRSIKENNFSKLYFLYGEEKMLVGTYAKRLKEKIIGKAPSDFNYHEFNDDSSIEDIANAVNILPFAEPCNFVSITDLNIEKMPEDDLKAYYEIISNIPETTTVVISMLTLMPAGAKASRWKKLSDIADKNGIAVDFAKRSVSDLRKLLISWANKRGLELLPKNAQLIIEYSGTNLNTLQNEMEKLCSYKKEGDITPDIINKLVTKNLEARVFDMADAVVRGQWDEAFEKFDLLMYQHEEPNAILAVLSTNYVDMYRVRTALSSGERSAKLSEDFDYKRKEFKIKKAENAVRRLSDEALDKSLELLAQANIVINGNAIDKRLVLEELICKLIMVSKR